MEPSNEREAEIARIIDRLSAQHRLDPARLDEIIAVLKFTMSRADSDFLIRYMRWRTDNPVEN